MRYLIAIPLILFPIALMAAPFKTKWPPINPKHEIITFSEEGPRSVSILLYGKNGVPLYLLDCYLTASEFSGRQDYSGDFECWLQPLYQKYEYRTLLTYTKTPIRNWESRGRFLLSEFTNPKNEAIGWGRVRTFHLRGMKLSLKIVSFKLATPAQIPYWADKNVPRINKLVFEYSVESDPAAQNSIQENHYSPEHH